MNNISTLSIWLSSTYILSKTVENPDVTEADAIENIDIGGPTMLRAAAKNFKHVTTIVHPSDYNEVIDRIKIIN